MKISKSKQELARITSENGGWRDGAESAVQCKLDDAVSFYRDIPYRDGDCWWGEHLDGCDIGQDRLIANWHQAILSRAEYFHLYPVPDADGWIEWNGGECPVDEGTLIDVRYRDGHEQVGCECGVWRSELYGTHYWLNSGGESNIIAYRLHKHEKVKSEFCESVMRSIPEPTAKPTIEQLAADYRNAKDYAERKQQEADEAKADADEKLAELVAAGKVQGLVLSVAEFEPEPELVITDWRDLRVGDEVEYVEGSQTWSIGMVGVVQRTDDDEGGDMNVRLLFGEKGSGWPRKWRFIRRP